MRVKYQSSSIDKFTFGDTVFSYLARKKSSMMLEDAMQRVCTTQDMESYEVAEMKGLHYLVSP